MCMKSANKYVACTPYPTNSITAVAQGGLPVIKQRHELTKLVVVFDSVDGDYKAGDVVYVRGDTCRHPQAKEVYEVEVGKPFVLLPYEFVKTMTRPYVRPEPTRVPTVVSLDGVVFSDD